ncbi:MAG: hypothetical protein E7385_00005 [Ruminococcaceae bacterium]|nr:hypothetical protein [Oscillospiraceae bacterium]
MKKKTIYEEIAYVLGLILLGLGTAFMELSDFGLSMIVAPAYILHVKISEFLPFFSFGMAGYVLQFFVLVLLCFVVRKFKLMYLISFVTAVLYGFVLDGFLYLFAFVPAEGIPLRIICYTVGMLLCAMGIAFFFKTYIAPAAYDLFVKEIVDTYNFKMNRVKTLYDCGSLIVAIVLSFAFFGIGKFVGIGIGTVLCAALNGLLIGLCTKVYDRFFSFVRFLPARKNAKGIKLD